MHTRKLNGHALLMLLLPLFTSSVEAANFTFLTNDALVGWVTFDEYLGNADDQVFPGINTIGAASQFSASNGNYGFLGGVMTSQGVTAFGPQPQLIFGHNEHTSVNMFGEWNNNFYGYFNVPFTQSLNGGTPSVITISNDQTYTGTFVLDDTSAGGRIEFTATGRYLLTWDEPSVRYSGDLATHFETVIPLLPDDWLGVAHETQTWEVLDGPYAGLTGMNTVTFFSTDPQAIPAEPPLPLGPPWTTTGFAATSGSGLGVEIGSETFGPGTATLAGGDTTTVNALYIGSNSSVSIDGAGTALSQDGFGYIDVGSGFGSIDFEDAALSITGGADVTTGILAIGAVLGEGSSTTMVGGAGSRLVMQADLGFGGFNQVGAAIFSGSMTVVDGGEVVIDGEVNQLTGEQLGPVLFVSGNSELLVDGSGSRIRMIGPGLGSPYVNPGNLFVGDFLGVVTGTHTAVEVVNGGSITLERAGMGAVVAPGPDSASTASVRIDGSGSLLDAAALLAIGASLGPDDPDTLLDSPGSATLEVGNGGIVRADRIVIGSTSQVMGNGGTLEGDVEVHGGIAPGSSPGVLTVDGDLTLFEDGHLLIEIAGEAAGTGYDVLNVTGTAFLGGTLEIVLLDGFVPSDDDTFNFLIAGSFNGDFHTWLLPVLGNGRTLALSHGAGGFTAAVTIVPLPAGLPLFGSVATLLGFMGLRRRATG